MPSQSPPLRNLQDILALEQTPYEQAMPARSTYDLIAAAAARFPKRQAFVYLPDGAPETPPATRTTGSSARANA